MIREVLNSAIQKKFFLMFFTCVFYIAGLAGFFSGNIIIFAFVGLILGIISIIKNYVSPKLVLFWYFTFFFAFFNAGLRVKTFDELSVIAPEKAEIQGQVVSVPSFVKEKSRFFFKVTSVSYGGISEQVKAKTLVTIDGTDKNKIVIGDFYRIKGKLRVPFGATNPSQFDYGKYLKNFNTFTTFYADRNSYYRLNKPVSLKWKFMQKLSDVRNGIIETHSKYLKSPNLELLGGVVFGDDAITPPEDLKISFTNSGLLHLLAASGMNVALIYGIWFFILKKLKAPFNFNVVSGIFVVIFYTMMTGLGASIIRAAIMLIFILLGKLINRDADSLSLLSFVALLMLIYNPSYINDVSFQLSFIVTFGLLMMSPLVFDKLKKIPAWLSGAIFIPIIAQIWVAPIQMFYFNTFSLYSIFANILILPFITVISFGGFISSVLSFKPLADNICFLFDFVLNPVLNVCVWISNYFSHLSHSLIYLPQISGFQIFIYYSIVFAVVLLLKYGINKKIFFSVLGLSLILTLSCIKFPNHKLEILAFDVQNADAFLIKTPNDKYFMIDSGKQGFNNGKSQAKYIILEYMKDMGIKNIDGLIITHFDSDHAGGAVDLMENLNIKKVYVNSLTDKSKIAERIYKVGGERIKLVKNNQIVFDSDNVKIKNLKADFDKKLENENSVITLISEKNVDFLFMGDAGILAFNKINKYLPDKIEVLKVGHHGAKNVLDKALLDRINPSYAIVSTGVNHYGHPNGVTLDILNHHKVKVLRTDWNHAIKSEVSYDKNNIDFKCFENRKWLECK